MCFDSDTAGQQAAAFARRPACQWPGNPSGRPQPHDPDSFIRNGAESFRKLLDDAPGFRLSHQLPLPDSRRRFRPRPGQRAEANREAVQKTNNPVLIDTYAQKLSHRLGVCRCRADGGRQAQTHLSAGRAGASRGGDLDPRGRVATAEAGGVLAAQAGAVRRDAGRVARVAPRPAMGTMGCGKFYSNTSLIAENPDAGLPELLAVLPSEPFRKLATEAVVDGRNIPNPDRQLKDIVLRLRNQFIEARLAEIQRDLSPGSTDEKGRN